MEIFPFLKKNKKKLLYIGSLLILVLVIPVTVAVTQIQQELRQRAANTIPITHIVIMDKENRSFDSYFGTFPGAEGTTHYTGTDGQQHTLNHQPDTLLNDIKHDPNSAHLAYDNGKMDKFALIPGAIQNGIDQADSQLYESDIPNYWKYAKIFTLDDHFFSTILGPSFANHFFSIAAEDNDVDANPVGGNWGCDAVPSTLVEERHANGQIEHVFPCFENKTLGDLLNQANISWKYYAPDQGTSGYIWSQYNAIGHVRKTTQWQQHVVNYTQFVQDAQSGNLPAVSWLVEPSNVSDHPPASACAGENWTVQQINAIMQNPNLWTHTAIILTWDDFGGFYDHVVPPKGPNGQTEFGFRVPTIIISPYAKQTFIDHTMYSFPSMLRFVENILGLPNLGFLDSTTSPLGDLTNSFDFTQQPLPPLVLQTRNCKGGPSPTPTPTPIPTINPTISPTPVHSPTPTATITPPITPSPTLTPTMTPVPTNTPQPTPTINPQATTLTITLCPHGLGNCGDNANPNSGGNTHPVHPDRTAHVFVYDLGSNFIKQSDGQVQYSASQVFSGTIDLGNLATGQYLMKVNIDGFLRRLIPQTIIITAGQNAAPRVSLITGDIYPDNQLDISDYNILISCYGNKANTSSCTNKQGADINDDGSVDAVDYNLLLRELSIQLGD